MVVKICKMRLDSGSKFFVKTEDGWHKVNRHRFFKEKRKLHRRWLKGEISN